MKTTQTKHEILEAAQLAGLDRYEITKGSNGYPQGLGDYAVIGFETYGEAETFAEENDCEIHLFKQRDGWQFWEDKGYMQRALTVEDYLKDLGDNYSYADTDNTYYAERLAEVAAEFDGDFDKLEKMIAAIKEIQNAVEIADERSSVIVEGLRYYETFPNETMKYREDVWTYAVGVLVKED